MTKGTSLPGNNKDTTNRIRTYLPAAGRQWLLPIYDPMVKWLGLDATRRILIDQAAIQQGHQVLDIGCGTGTLIALIKRLHPDVEVTGLDPDPQALARAKSKVTKTDPVARFDQGFADQLPYPKASFDRIFSSFMFHHLKSGEKEQTLREVVRVLKPGGSFHLLDFGHPEHGKSLIARLMHFNHHLKDNAENRIISLMQQAGFVTPQKINHTTMLFGRIVYFMAWAPAATNK